MIPAFIVVIAAALVDWVAVAKGWRKVELVMKPLTLVLLFLVLLVYGWMATGFVSLPLILFGIGVLFSLAGDVFLMLAERWFLPGLVAFLCAHVAYTVGFNVPIPKVSMLWAIALAVLLAITAARVLRRIIIGVREKGQGKMAIPVAVYGVIITLMLLSALLTLYRDDWVTAAAGLVSLGAALFYISDVILAWNKFVTPMKNGRVANMVCYHLGQIALVAGVILQFAK
jgi:uncharacterized membrane protein YhhN